MVFDNHVKTTPWSHIVVRNDKLENASDTLRKEKKVLLTSARKKLGQNSTHSSAGTGTPLLLVIPKIRGACPLCAIAKSILELA